MGKNKINKQNKTFNNSISNKSSYKTLNNEITFLKEVIYREREEYSDNCKINTDLFNKNKDLNNKNNIFKIEKSELEDKIKNIQLKFEFKQKKNVQLEEQITNLEDEKKKQYLLINNLKKKDQAQEILITNLKEETNKLQTLLINLKNKLENARQNPEKIYLMSIWERVVHYCKKIIFIE